VIRRWRALGGRSAVRRALAIVVVAIAALIVPSGQAPATLDWHLAAVTRYNGFDLWSWEIGTLVDRGIRAFSIVPSTRDGPDVVRAYARLSGEAARARGARDNLYARREIDRSVAGLSEAQQSLDSLNGQVAALRPLVEQTLSDEIESELRRQQLQAGLWTGDPLTSFPFVRPALVPGVFFQLGPLPDLLVVAPRDRIELIGSVLVQPGLPPQQLDDLEDQADGRDLSSVVTDIGGLAAYPSMVPDDSSIQDLVITVSHEWTHHYLALRPLGMAYFSSYQMREINETVADMVGHEVGAAVFERYYAATEPAPSRSTAAPTSRQPPKPDFWTLMRGIRVTVEGYLARRDVIGADAYMASARLDLAQQGYYVRRLNTAYLAFFGSYANSANPYEAKLRRLRARSGSLAAFLQTVSQVRSPADLDQALRQTAGSPS